MDDHRLRVCLGRTLELAEVRLLLRDWPGLAGPLIHVPDPLSLEDDVAEALAAALAPRYRVLSVQPRGASPYQVDASDLLAVLDQFGFERPVIVAEALGGVPALLVAAWHPRRVAGLVLIDPTSDPPSADCLMARALRDCPPDVIALRDALQCPKLDLSRGSWLVSDIERFLAQLVPVT